MFLCHKLLKSSLITSFMTERSALLAFHGAPELVRLYTRYLHEAGYHPIDVVVDAQHLFEKHQQRTYTLYAMDVNLGNSGGNDFTAAQRLHGEIQPRLENDTAQFYPASASDAVVEKAREQGLPAISKNELDRIIASYVEDEISGNL